MLALIMLWHGDDLLSIFSAVSRRADETDLVELNTESICMLFGCPLTNVLGFHFQRVQWRGHKTTTWWPMPVELSQFNRLNEPCTRV